MQDALTNPVTLTPRAEKRVAEMLRTEPAGSILRLAVNGGGCSGFQYAFEIEPAAESDDLIVGSLPSALAVDPVSLDLIKGSQVDFVDDLIGQSFKVLNPNAKSSCGCGVSFSL